MLINALLQECFEIAYNPSLLPIEEPILLEKKDLALFEILEARLSARTRRQAFQ